MLIPFIPFHLRYILFNSLLLILFANQLYIRRIYNNKIIKAL